MSDEEEKRKDISQLIEKIVTSNKGNIDPKLFGELKTICKSSVQFVELAYVQIYEQLKKDHCEVRLASLRLIKELFERSHCFRNLLLDDFQEFINFTLEIDPQYPLPLPKEAAATLKKETVSLIEHWKNKYAGHYKKLSIAYHYLKSSNKVDFESEAIRTQAERRRLEEEQRRKESFQKKRLEEIQEEMIEIAEEMRNCLIQIQNCFDLLIPSVNFFDIIREEPTQDKDIDSDSNDKDGRQSEDSESESEQLFQQQPWYRNFTPITCSIPDTVNVTETDDNKDIINSLEDQVRLIDARYVPKINKWLEILTKYGSEEDNIKRAIDMKAYMTKAKDKFQHLQIEKKKKTKTIDTQDSDEESDFEEVPEKEGYEANIPEELHEEYGIKKKNIRKAKPTGSWSVLQENSEEDPASYQAAVKAIEKKFEKNTESYNQSSSQDSKSAISGRTKKLKEIAPIVPFGNDLLNWGSKIEVPLLPNYDLEHRFYTKKDIDNEDKIDKNALASYSSRVINYVGKRELAKWKCRALMPNGSLCERMDKKKCPFHGTIIPRNEFGVAAEGYIDESKEIKKKEKNPWEDEELLREIEAAKGVSLMKKKKRGKQKDTQLTNIDKIKNTSRDRLKKKLLHKSAIKRVGELLDTIDMKKHKDKFAKYFWTHFYISIKRT